jgi:hypothetical protein
MFLLLLVLTCHQQDSAEVGSAALAMYEVTELMCDECPDADALGAERHNMLLSKLLAAHEQVQRLPGTADQQKEESGIQ